MASTWVNLACASMYAIIFFRQENEMVTRFSNDLLNPYGPHSVKLRRFLHSFPLQKLIGAAPGWLLPWFT